MIRIANCDEEEANQPGSLRLAEYVDTFIAQEVCTAYVVVWLLVMSEQQSKTH
jgi:hypothetical protein